MRRPRPDRRLEHHYTFYFHIHPLGQFFDTYGSTRRIGFVEVAHHYFVDGAEVGKVREIDGELNEVGKATASRVCDSREILEDAFGLCRETFRYHFHGRRVERNLTGTVNRVHYSDGLRIRADGGGGQIGLYDGTFVHGALSFCC